MNSTVKKVFKVIGGIILAGMMAGIGVGVWEKLLSPLLGYLYFGAEYCYTLTIKVISHFLSGYEDNIYRDAVKETRIISYFKILMATWLLVMAGFFLWIFDGFQHIQKDLKKILIRNPKKILFVFSILSFLTPFILMQDIQRKRLSINSKQSLEILRPYIGEKEFRLLRSEYFSVRTKYEFVSFGDKLELHAEKHSIKIPLMKKRD